MSSRLDEVILKCHEYGKQAQRKQPEEKKIESKMNHERVIGTGHEIQSESLGDMAGDIMSRIEKRMTEAKKCHEMNPMNNAEFYNEFGVEVIPKEIDSLIDNKMYRNRHKWLIRNYGLVYFKKLAEIARTKDNPSRWYARATQKKNNNWESYTLPMLERLFEKEARMRERLEKLGADLKFLPFYLKAEGKLHFELIEELFEISLKKNNPDFYFRRCVKDELARLG